MAPLSQEEFEAGRSTSVQTVLFLFKSRRDLAYSADEVLFELGNVGVILTRTEVLQALQSLIGARRLTQALIGDEVYYRYDNFIGLRPRG